jgi:hypothetical protein
MNMEDEETDHPGVQSQARASFAMPEFSMKRDRAAAYGT